MVGQMICVINSDNGRDPSLKWIIFKRPSKVSN